MTALRIFATDKPVTRFAPFAIKPMSKKDEEFWKLLRERREQDK